MPKISSVKNNARFKISGKNKKEYLCLKVLKVKRKYKVVKMIINAKCNKVRAK